MSEILPKAIQDEFIILNKNIKYPTYPDQDFTNSILEDQIFNNYSEENIKKSFNEFIATFTNCKNITYEIIEKNLHGIQEYCHNLNLKIMPYIFYFYLIEKIINIVEKIFFKSEIPENLKKDLFYDDLVFDCTHSKDKFSLLYKNEFKGQEDINKLSQIFSPIIERYNKLLKNENEIGNILIRTIKYLHKYLFTPFEDKLNKFKDIKIFHEDDFFKSKINEENEIVLLDIIIYLKKLEFLDLLFYNSALLDKNDICNLNEDSVDWQNLSIILFRLIPKNAEEIRNTLLESRKNPHLGNSILSNVEINESATSLVFSGLKNYLYYKTNENKSIIDSKKYLIKSKPENLTEFFDILKKFKYVIGKLMPSIEFRRKIYVKKEFPTINRMYIEKMMNFMKGENLPINSNRLSLINNIPIAEDLPIIYRDKLPDKEYKRHYVSVTILHNEKIYFKDEKNESIISSVMEFFKPSEGNKQIENQFRKNTIMIAVHGGGFLGSSTFYQERYIRKWAKILNIPIFGINYSLAPQYPYPEALNDIYQAYMWILKHAKEELNMDIKHIILTGDSAGGNLVLGLNNLLITVKEYESEFGQSILLPEFILSSYPVTYISLKNISNSLLLSLFDPMLNIDVTNYTYKVYVGNYELEEEDPYLNPVKVNDYILDRMHTKIRITFGTEDVFRGDGLKMLNVFSKYNNRPNNNNYIDVRGYDMMYLTHSFNGLSEDIQQISRNVIIPEVEDFLNNIIE